MKTIKLIALVLVLCLTALVNAAGGGQSTAPNSAPVRQAHCCAAQQQGDSQATHSCMKDGAQCACCRAHHAEHTQTATTQANDDCCAGSDCCKAGDCCKGSDHCKDCACCKAHKTHAQHSAAAAQATQTSAHDCCACCAASCETQLGRR
jgi:hypothetical protein